MTLARYKQKRDFKATPEPKGRVEKSGPQLRYVIQKHDARRLHYDFRLELDGVLKSWAVPKGPSLDPAARRLAVEVEDHPIDYGDFEGVIPEKHYGAGNVIVWDRGTWTPLGDARADLAKGHLRFELDGERLSGKWSLVRLKPRAGEEGGQPSWFLIKGHDQAERHGDEAEITARETASVMSGREVDEVDTPKAAQTRTRKAATGKTSLPSPARSPASSKKSGTKRRPVAAPGVSEAPMELAPQLATLATRPPADPQGWLTEIKFDGYRILARFDARGAVRLFSRNGHDWTDKAPALAEALAPCGLRSSWIDGELVAIGDDGRPSFQQLQNAFSGETAGATLRYYAFDMPWLNGVDVSARPLVERKQVLHEALRALDEASMVRFSEHVSQGPEAVFRHACQHGLEGVILKRADSAYLAGRRNADWLKLKCQQRQEFVIGGYTDPQGGRVGFGALLLGQYDEQGDLRYAGRVGTGFDQKGLLAMKKRLDRLAVSKPAFAKPPTGADARGVHWVRPELVAEVRFAELTSEGIVRQGSFQGLREDKPAQQVKPEKAVEPKPPAHAKASKTPPKAPPKGAAADTVAGVRITHAERIVIPEQGVTKLDVARYYESMADWVLPQLENRLVSLLRCPEGAAHECFFQKHLPTFSAAPDVRMLPVKEKNGSSDYLYVDSLTGLIGLVQFGVLEFHAWGSRVDKLEKPDRMIFDLDPAEDVRWKAVLDAALLLHRMLDELGLRNFLKTSGGKGLHVEVPLSRVHDWDTVKDFSHAVADHLSRVFPDRFVSVSTKAKRGGKIFIDYLRNGRGATAVAAYATRARASASVAMPLDWDALSGLKAANTFTLFNAREHVDSRGTDPWADYASTAQRITRDMMKTFGMTGTR